MTIQKNWTLFLILFLSQFTNLPELMAQQYPPSIPTASKIEVYKEVGNTKLKAWVFNPTDHPTTDQKPAIVFFFGGGWEQGTPAQFTKHCEYFAARGMVAITADYRVASRHNAKPYQCVEDAKSIIRWMRQNAKQLGIDPDRIVAAGGSAGGHLAASTATLPKYDHPEENLSISSTPNALALFNPVLLTADIPDLLELPAKSKKKLLNRFEGDPATLSPANYIPTNMGPSIIFHGTADKTVPYRTAEIFHQLAIKKGNDCTLVAYEGEGHGFFNYGRKNNGPFVSTVQKLDDFLVEQGYIEAVVGISKEPTSTAVGKHFTISTPEAQGISSKAILSFIERAEKEIDALHSFMIIKNGKKVSEGWWSPYAPDAPHVMHSLSKSFTSTAIGLLIEEGKLSLNDKVTSFFPEYVPETPSWQWKQMRIRDLLTMNTGHIEEPTVWFSEGDWVKYFLETEVPLAPGTHFKYNSPATYMLSAILQKVTGEKLVDYLTPRLFEPLQIKKPRWDVCPKGINTGGWGMSITTEDIAKLGQLYLQKGNWNGQQLLSEEWATLATSKQVSNGSDPNNEWNQGYGFQFWQCRHNAFRGDGAMGQFCIVLPEKETVIAITAGVNDMGHIMTVAWEELLPNMQDHSLPAAPKQVTSLQNKTSSLQLSPISGTSTSPISRKVSRKSYTINDNELGIQEINFDVHKTPHAIHIKTKEGDLKIPIGKEDYLKSTVSQFLPNAANLQQKIAANGAWVNEQEYQLRIYFHEMPARITYTFQFEKNQLTWTSKLEHSLFGPRTPVELIGSK